MTTPQGEHAKTALPTITRYKIDYSWGDRSSTPSGIPDFAGAWVRYEDHAAELRRLHAQVAELTAAEPVVPAAWRKRIDNAAKAMSLIQASNNLGDLETMSSHALAGLTAIQSTYVLDPVQPAPQGVAYAELEKKHRDFVETVSLMLDAIGYKEDYARQWPKEKASITFKRWFDEQRASHGQAPAGATAAAEIVELLGCSGCLKAHTKERALATVSRILSAQHGGAL